MTDTTKIASSVLSQMNVEDLLTLDINNVEIITDIPVVPAGFYNFTVKNSGLGTTGKAGEEKPAIKVELALTGCEGTDNAADMEIVSNLDLANSPLKYTENFGLTAKDGYGVRAFATFANGFAQSTGITQVQALVEAINGGTGVCYISINRYLPQGQADAPENYRERNRIDVKQVVWA